MEGGQQLGAGGQREWKWEIYVTVSTIKKSLTAVLINENLIKVVLLVYTEV